jgi:hypothetical protein
MGAASARSARRLKRTRRIAPNRAFAAGLLLPARRSTQNVSVVESISEDPPRESAGDPIGWRHAGILTV